MTGLNSAAKFFGQTRVVLQQAQDVPQFTTCLEYILSTILNVSHNRSDISAHDTALIQLELFSRLMQQEQCITSQLWISFFWSSFAATSHLLLAGEIMELHAPTLPSFVHGVFLSHLSPS